MHTNTPETNQSSDRRSIYAGKCKIGPIANETHRQSIWKNENDQYYTENKKFSKADRQTSAVAREPV